MTHRGLVEAKVHLRDAAIRTRRNGENHMRFFTFPTLRNH
jgi:hypothetical protein